MLASAIIFLNQEWANPDQFIRNTESVFFNRFWIPVSNIHRFYSYVHMFLIFMQLIITHFKCRFKKFNLNNLILVSKSKYILYVQTHLSNEKCWWLIVTSVTVKYFPKYIWIVCLSSLLGEFCHNEQTRLSISFYSSQLALIQSKFIIIELNPKSIRPHHRFHHHSRLSSAIDASWKSYMVCSVVS